MLTSIISAIGNNNSIYPLLIRDCGIENPAKVAMTYKQNKSDKYIAKNAVRERIIDEYATSAVWLGGIPLVEKICNKFISKKGFNPNISSELLKGDAFQNINANIEQFKTKAPDAVMDLIKIRENQKLYQNLNGIKLLASIAIPTLIMGFILPKINFKITKNVMQKKLKDAVIPTNQVTFEEFEEQIKRKNNPSFGSNLFSQLSNLTTVQKMAITDLGLSAGRISTARNKNEAFDNAVKMTGMIYLNYFAPKQTAKLFDKLTKKIFKLNVNLDPVVFCDKDFINAVKNKSIKFPLSEKPQDILSFIDLNPDSVITKLAVKTKLIKMYNSTTRDPRKYVNIKDLNEFIKNIKDFSESAIKSKGIEEFAKRAKMAKCVNIIANVALSSFLLAYCLPKVQFIIRKMVIKSKLEPGLVQNQRDEKV